MNPFSPDALISLLVALLPVVTFLLALIAFDSFKLLRPRAVIWLIAFGAVIAVVSFVINTTLMRAFSIPQAALVRYVAPVVEEVLKASLVLWLIRRRRVGFLVDSAISGFAIGAGFAIVENLYFFQQLTTTNVLVWIIRGFGTAMMHGGATAIVGIISKYFADKWSARRHLVFPFGLGIAIVVHSAYNHFFVSPLLSTLGIVVLLPAVIALVFSRSERATRDWLGIRFDTDQDLLEMINTGRATESRVGHYLEELRHRFEGAVVADMVCLIRIHLELSIRAKGLLLMREAGFSAPPTPEVEAQFEEMKYLEHAIGRTGLLAIAPIFNMSDRELWQLYMLRGD